MLRPVSLLAALTVVAAALPAALAQPLSGRPAAVPPDPDLERAGAVIGTIEIDVGDVFDLSDAREDNFLFRTVDRLHPATRRAVIARQLAFAPGDPYDARKLEESARILRADRYLGEVTITPVRWDGHAVDVRVATRDVWSLNASVGLGRAGGANSTSMLVQDTNLLGTGKSLTLKHTSNVDRTGTELRWDDPAVLGSHVRTRLSWIDADDGRSWSAEIGRPFSTLDSRWSAAVSASTDDRIDDLYRLGRAVDEIAVHESRWELRGGLSDGVDENGRVLRWTAGLTFQDRRTGPPAGADGPVSEHLTLAFPWVAWDRETASFETERNLDQIARTEDVPVGARWHLRLGFSAAAFGATRDELVADATASRGWRPSERQLFLLEGGLSGRWGSAGPANVWSEGSARWYWRDLPSGVLAVEVEGAAAERLDPGRQLLLGGDNGLRGYPLRYQEGDARARLTVEQRVFTNWYPFRLARVGGAAFWDAGRVWGAPGDDGLGLLQDVGVGLRIASTRSGLGSMIHLDLAMPLGGPADLAGIQWSVSTHETF